ncbi:CHASE3 domain-containing protein [uncultured Vibrio sp.]|uniref:CHASE3 domain-containing protein n=1 Tax=uncultured Vibrio sp. TaxID=114054 RepID=UPI0025D3B556|nr:CHASE3 domain-containing protein [uncultured Vibrio sp.]
MFNIVRWFDETSIQKKLLTIFSIPVVLMVLVSMLVYTNTQSMVNDNQWVVHTQKAISRAQELMTLTVDMETGQRGFLVTGDEQFLEPYIQALTVWDEKIAVLARQVSDNPPQVHRLENINALHLQWLETIGLTEINLRRKVSQGTENMQSVIDHVELEEGKAIIGAIRAEIDLFIAIEESLILTRIQASERSADSTVIVLVIGTLLSALMTVVIAYWSSTRLKQRIQTLLTGANHLSSGNLAEGKLTLSNEAATSSIDEVALLASAFREMADNLYSTDKKIRENNEVLKQEKVKAEAAVKAKSEFLSTMSHEIRTPLNGVLGIAQIIDHETKEPSTKEYASIILSSGHHLLTIINDILDFTRIEENRLELEHDPFLIDQVISPVCKTLEPLVAEKSVQFIVQNEVKATTEFIGDSARLRQILFNLVGNAAKFTDKGQVIVKAEHDTRRRELILSVKDSGLGIPTEKQATIFNSFEQADASTTRKFGGTGLGLSIVSKLVELMKGEITLKSEEGLGSLFTVTIPVESTEVKSIANVEDDNESDLSAVKVSGLSVLIAEDNPVNAFIAKRFCEELGYHAELAENGHVAIKMVEAKDYDLILMDNHMPVVNGIEATHIIRSELKKDVIIFAYTADVCQEAKGRLLNAGVDCVLEKPLERDSFLDAFGRFIPQQNRA